MNRSRQPERFLATILFTDIVGSTDIAAELGDRDWRRVVAAHHVAIRQVLRRFGGREIDTAGDGFFCSFDQPAQAVRTADTILTEAAKLGLALRAGLHTGECERIGPKVGGIAVHIAARVMSEATGGEVLVSSTVRELVSGSGLSFADRGTHTLKGVPDEWHLFSLAREQAFTVGSADAARAALPALADSTRRRRLELLVGGIAALAIVIAGAAAVSGLFGARAPVAPAVPPGPNTVVVLDAASGHITDVRGVPNGPVAVAATADHLWVAALDAGLVVDLPTAAGATDRSFGRVGRPTGLADGGDQVWVADALDQTVTLLDAASGDVLNTIDRLLARRITFGLGSAWLTDDIADVVRRLDAQSGDVIAVVPLDAGTFPTGIGVGFDAVWVTNPGTSTITRIDPSSSTISENAIALRYVPESISAGGSDVWITSRASDYVMRLDPRTNSVTGSIAVCDQPVAIAADGETAWVACAGTREVWHIDREGAAISKTSIDGVPTDIVVANGRVYVTVRR